MRIVRAVVARQAIIARWAGNKKTVRATRADNEITNKRRCEPHGQIKEKTNNERTMNEQKTKKERTKDEQMTVRAAQADKEKTKKRRCESHGQIKK